MTFLLILLALALAMGAETAHLSLHDGRSASPPRSHLDDPGFRSPGARV